MSKEQRDIYKEEGWVFKCYRSIDRVYYDESTNLPSSVAFGFAFIAEKDGILIPSDECANRDEACADVCERIKLWVDGLELPIKD